MTQQTTPHAAAHVDAVRGHGSAKGLCGASYRLQFRNGVGFAEAVAIVPGLARAGITHLYASPIFAATSGSTHGYDVIDHNLIEPTLGGADGFDCLSETLKRHHMKLIVDIVPNHMAASSENPWWCDVLRHGAGSRFARHFDIDWSAPKLILPFLGKPYGDALEDGDLTRGEHPTLGPALFVHDVPFPLRPGTETIDDLHACHEAQHYRLAFWRIGRDGLTYRRFFEITGLVGVAVERPDVFADVHRLTLARVAAGQIDALRVDHVDGLTDPAAYCAALAQAAGVPIVVEKILEPGEALPDWPVAGTTGYEFIAAMAALFVDPDGVNRLAQDYRALAEDDVGALIRAAKHEIINRNLAGELLRLTDLALKLFADDLEARDHGPFTVREGLAALLVGMPVYRTYVAPDAAGPASISADDRAVLQHACAAAKTEPLDNPLVVDDLAALLSNPRGDALSADFVARFQQTSGPLTAKSVEDTVFFRHHRYLGFNEVGGGGGTFGDEAFLSLGAKGGLAATQTHDTKRGEDARARLYALSTPEATARFAQIWPTLPGEIPDRLKWALGQMLFASAPLEPDAAFAGRFRETALKTVREAKEETSWTAQNGPFEDAIVAAADAMSGTLTGLAPLERAWRAGAVISLSQTLLKCIGNTMPDIYQGTFAWDFAMVDPDNRRPVDFASRTVLRDTAMAASPASLLNDWMQGAIKARVLLEALQLRRERPQLFARGVLRRVPVTGREAGVAAFALEEGDDVCLIAVPTRPYGALGSSGLSLGFTGAVNVELDRALTTRITGTPLGPGICELSGFFAAFPVLLAANFGESAR